MRTPQYEDGRRNAVKACVEWLHIRAYNMNDPHAREVLNVAAFHLGQAFKVHNPVTMAPLEGVHEGKTPGRTLAP